MDNYRIDKNGIVYKLNMYNDYKPVKNRNAINMTNGKLIELYNSYNETPLVVDYTKYIEDNLDTTYYKQHPFIDRIVVDKDSNIYLLKALLKYDNTNGVHYEYSMRKAKPSKMYNREYYALNITHDGKERNTTAHRIIAETWHQDTYFDGAEVDHIDEDGLNNDIDNLQWLSRADNVAKRDRLGSPMSKSIDITNIETNETVTYASLKDAAEALGMSSPAIHIQMKADSVILGKYKAKYTNDEITTYKDNGPDKRSVQIKLYDKTDDKTLTFDSIKEACEFLDISAKSMNTYIQRHKQGVGKSIKKKRYVLVTD